MTQVVLDTDFLSSFLKIKRLPLVRDFYQAEDLLIPPAVYREVSITRIAAELAELFWVRVQAPKADGVRAVCQRPGFEGLGLGESEAIALALQLEGSVLLISDNKARHRANQIGLDAVAIPAFLIACKETGFLGREALASVVQDLQERDRYGFSKAVLDRLLP